MIEPYFTRPGEFNEIHHKLLNDINNCTERLLVSVAFISEPSLCTSLIQKSKQKNLDERIILNMPDINRNHSLADLLQKHCNSVNLGTYISENNQSNMHHKFIICDNILWVGSYNFTTYAKNNNWENMLRIKDITILKKFVLEFEYMWIVGDTVNNYLVKGTCMKCKKIVTDPLSHYSIVVNAGEITTNGFPIFDVYCNNEYNDIPFQTSCDFCKKRILSNQSIVSNTTSYLAVYCVDCAYKYLWSKNIFEEDN